MTWLSGITRVCIKHTFAGVTPCLHPALLEANCCARAGPCLQPLFPLHPHPPTAAAPTGGRHRAAHGLPEPAVRRRGPVQHGQGAAGGGGRPGGQGQGVCVGGGGPGEAKAEGARARGAATSAAMSSSCPCVCCTSAVDTSDCMPGAAPAVKKLQRWHVAAPHALSSSLLAVTRAHSVQHVCHAGTVDQVVTVCLCLWCAATTGRQGGAGVHHLPPAAGAADGSRGQGSTRSGGGGASSRGGGGGGSCSGHKGGPGGGSGSCAR
jgi:hypothetical protein